MENEIKILQEQILKKFNLKSIHYFGDHKNFVFKCVNQNDRVLALKVFSINEKRREEDQKKAWRDIAFHNYAASPLRLPELVDSAIESEIGIYLLTEFKEMTEVTIEDLKREPKTLEKIFNRITAFHSIKPSSLNPGLRARIFDENLKNNSWMVEALTESKEFDQKQMACAKKICIDFKKNSLARLKTLIHGDCRLQNFYLDSEGSIQLKDFEHAQISSPLIDWASLYISVTSENERQKIQKAAFEEVKDDSTKALQAFNFALLHRASSWIKYNTCYAKDTELAKKRLKQAVEFLKGEVL